MALMATAMALVGGLGCATAVVTSVATRKGAPVNGQIVMKDAIVAFGVPGPELTQKIKRPALAFIGKEHTYLLVKGGDELQRIAQELPAEQVVVTEDSQHLYLDGEATWGTLDIRYQLAPDSERAAQEAPKLRSLGFQQISPNAYSKQIAVEGKVYPALAITPDSPHLLLKPRPLAFRAPPTGGGHPDLGYLAFLPATLAVDIVTAPLQLIGFLMLR